MRSVVLALLAMSSAVQAEVRKPEKVLQEFYSWVLSERDNKRSSLPGANDLGKLATVLSPHLMGLINDVSLAEKRCFAFVEGTTDKPYFFESDVFIGNWGGVDEVAYGKVESTDYKAMVDVTHFSVNRNFAKASFGRVEVWINKLDMRFDSGGWYIHDVIYEGGSTLTSVFYRYLSNSDKWCRS